CNPTVCGDMQLGGFETCDGDLFGDVTCADYGFTGGTLACNDTCDAIDESGCFNQECGNGVLEGDEECDMMDFGAATCEDFDLISGELACNDDCTIDTAMCSTCGNDLIDDPFFFIGAGLGRSTLIPLGFGGGGNLACNASCDAVDESDCEQWWAEDFEDDAPFQAEWVLGGNVNWAITTTMPHGGMFTGESGTITHNELTYIEVDLNFVAAGSVTFWRRTSSEGSFDFLRFYVDGVQQGSWSGTTAWTMQMYNITAGAHTLRWAYTKDGSVNAGSDKVWVDDITTVNAVLP
ncbi:MAG: hypothetical protein KC457_27660, partial [Myxococcales bacterium]|nr:hypothetical protein [Myxococcales bacterium]